MTERLHAAWAAWDRFWFAPVDPRPVAVMRMTLAALLLWWWAWLWPELPVLFVDAGVHDPELLANDWDQPHLAITQGWSLGQLQLAHALGTLLLVAYGVGLGTPVVKFAAVAMLVVAYHRAPWVWNGGDRLIRIWAVIMCLAPSGAAWSVDAWARARQGLPVRRTVPILVHRLVQIQLVMMYTWTGIDKLMHPHWQQGTAVWWSMSDANFSRAAWLYDPLLHTTPGLWATALLTVFTLIFEVGFLPGVWFERTRKLTLAAGVALHGGIFFALSVGMFGPASVWGYQSFLDGARPLPEPESEPEPEPEGSDTTNRLTSSAPS